ncbi:uncharacterized protein EI97DRAFT_461749 [Westerdykella ornata]|uniref:Uncharacterized protein n=1 Tax=Westerdykella ornata TaxID=318751 RepID=A0A6A6J8R4_WESOR|nr:uncharacterized protein EI97DRAFT_461749 [Westerdykella ornata]KAF2272647.1 hypothetical protein EI97DRAFT_461749 [Westerdykella ornata]
MTSPSFFDRLVYDVRVVIYEHMDLPPLGDGKDFSGLWLSCRQAKKELEAAAAKAARRYLEQFKGASKANMGMIMRPLPPLMDLQDLNIRLPIAALWSDRQWVPLFTKNFNKVAIVFQGELPYTHVMSYLTSPSDRLHALTRLLEKYTKFDFGRARGYPELVHWRLQDTKPMAKRISIAWDLRPSHSHGTPLPLRGGGFGEPLSCKARSMPTTYQQNPSSTGYVVKTGLCWKLE